VKLEDLSDAVLACSTPVQVSRHLPTPMVNGRKQGRPICHEFRILAAVMPMKQKDLQRLPEGQRTEGGVDVFSKEPLQTARVNECRVADRICYRGVNYQVELVDDWFEQGGFYQALCVRLDR